MNDSLSSKLQSLKNTYYSCLAGLFIFCSCFPVLIAGTLPVRERLPVHDREFSVSNNWYEGALLGNGDLGVTVYGTDDLLTFAVGKNDFWDRRYYFHLFKPLTFRKYMEMVKNDWQADPKTGLTRHPEEIYELKDPELLPLIDGKRRLDKWHKPTPKPVCQINILQPEDSNGSGNLNPKPAIHTLSLEKAELTTITPGFRIESRIQKNSNLVFIQLQGISGKTIISLKRNPDSTDSGIALPRHLVDRGLGLVIQDMPPERTYPEGFRCAAAAKLLNGPKPVLLNSEIRWTVTEDCTLVLAVATTRDNSKPEAWARELLREVSTGGEFQLRQEHLNEWEKFWDRSWIRIDDMTVEDTWYFCNYLLASASRPGAVAPGLFGPWIVLDRSAWGGSYTTDYNFQQTFAAALSSNHPELLEPYFSTLEDMLPAAREFAKDIYETEGIAFPHEIYPIDMSGQMRATDTYVVETPYLVQHFWEYYKYTGDQEFLESRAYPIVAECADFLAGYATSEENGKFAFDPTRSCEHHGLLKGLPFNRNGTPELGFARYIFKAALEGAAIVGETDRRRQKWMAVSSGLPGYASMRNQLGKVFLDSEVENVKLTASPPVQFTLDKRPSKTPGNHGPWMFYNVPTSIVQIWPAGQIDMDSPADELLTAIRTWMTLKFEGSNDLVTRHVAASRLGIPTFKEFKKDISDRLMINQTITTKVNQLKTGLNFDKGYFEYWANGIYTENCGLPLVINEMMLQSHNGVIKLFPTMDFYRSAQFNSLRAQGGFLVSSEMEFGFIKWAEITATGDQQCRVRLPWPIEIVSAIKISSGEKIAVENIGSDIIFTAEKDETYRITPTTARNR